MKKQDNVHASRQSFYKEGVPASFFTAIHVMDQFQMEVRLNELRTWRPPKNEVKNERQI